MLFRSAHNSGATTSSKSGSFAFLFENCTDPYTKIEIQCTSNTAIHPDDNNLFELNNLVIYYEPSIKTQPVSVNVCEGSSALFMVDVSGTNPSYQWQKYNGSTWSDVSGATGETLSIPSVSTGDAGSYHCIITGECSTSITSSTVTLTMLANTSIDAQPAGTSICAGVNASLTVVAGGTNLTYQWQKQSGSLWNNVPGATTATLSFNPASTGDAGAYHCIVHGDCSTDITSDPATLTVNPITSINTQPASEIGRASCRERV